MFCSHHAGLSCQLGKDIYARLFGSQTFSRQCPVPERALPTDLRAVCGYCVTGNRPTRARGTCETRSGRPGYGLRPNTVVPMGSPSPDGSRSKRVRRVHVLPRVTKDTPSFTTEEPPRSLEDVWSPKYEEFGLPGVITPEKGSGYEPSNYGGAGFAGKTNWDPRSARRGSGSTSRFGGLWPQSRF
jgi:hypothetical protein